ncbi:hypothetical protein VTO42DRAFT_5599 [Malbranchea cinnamomea]
MFLVLLLSNPWPSTEESTLAQWVLFMDERGQPPRVNSVREMTNLLANRDDSCLSTYCWHQLGQSIHQPPF